MPAINTKRAEASSAALLLCGPRLETGCGELGSLRITMIGKKSLVGGSISDEVIVLHGGRLIDGDHCRGSSCCRRDVYPCLPHRPAYRRLSVATV